MNTFMIKTTALAAIMAAMSTTAASAQSAYRTAPVLEAPQGYSNQMKSPPSGDGILEIERVSPYQGMEEEEQSPEYNNSDISAPDTTRILEGPRYTTKEEMPEEEEDQVFYGPSVQGWNNSVNARPDFPNYQPSPQPEPTSMSGIRALAAVAHLQPQYVNNSSTGSRPDPKKKKPKKRR